ncbi:ABC-2 transporter permease [Peptoniphilus sp. MSJ-1]|uniref:ABC-2 transporter permease n=1 Tax=Peptoniphilus ovalis TaxID=2841503 RepID=A0ABS6FEN7_9FIRM|nr:ABC-2 transporter permease [Peptoniphilus ovalis]MBU5668523.1 ABC-2 transporter permease [Peptoniphilus ovalis]
MSEIKKILKLDWVTTRPYFTIKNLLVMIFLCAILFFSTKNPLTTVSMPLIFAILYSSYPFLVGEDAGIDALYRIFGIKSKNVVLGRYIFSVFLYIGFALFGLLVALVLFLLGNKINASEVLGSYGIYTIIYLLIVNFQYPFFFKLGYQKARLVAMVGIFLFGGIAGALFAGFSELILSLSQNPTVLIIAGLVMIAIIFAISINFSIRFYRKKDF